MSHPAITGAMLIGAEERIAATTFRAVNATSGELGGPAFSESTSTDVADACALAADASRIFSELEPSRRAHFLEAVARAITTLGDALIERAVLESALPRQRLEAERARTTSQLAFMARFVQQGAWMDATIDHAMPERQPLPRPDLRRRNVALGPVAVFGASNFPLAFSVAGGDTASAFAAGCPVVVKGHPAHPGTGELVARAVRAAVQDNDLPPGVFSYLPGSTHALSRALVADPRIKAVGFTGSRAGGLALLQVAAAREEPIPVFAEMSSINPVILFPAAAQARGEELATAYVASLTLGAGQFCTNPGLLIALEGTGLDAFVAAAATALRRIPAQQMLTRGIHVNFQQGVSTLASHAAVETRARGLPSQHPAQAQAALFATDVAAIKADAALTREVFGASSLVVCARDTQEIVDLIGSLEGQLTATLLFDVADEPLVARLIPLIEAKVGRIVANGWPTGVEVCHAMVHGGPFPATSDGRSSSVGALAVQRFLRPICYQNFPERLLPEALREANPHRLPRRADGVTTGT
jgi:NADP-dependent aldehyde dehydrogenase